MEPSSSGLGRCPVTALTGVRLPLVPPKIRRYRLSKKPIVGFQHTHSPLKPGELDVIIVGSSRSIHLDYETCNADWSPCYSIWDPETKTMKFVDKDNNDA